MYGRGAIMGLTVAALLTGCSGAQDEAATLPSVTESATSAAPATPTPTPTVSTPGAITAAQAKKTATQFFAAVNQVAQEGGGYERYESIVHADCRPCGQQGERLRSLTANGQRVVGGVIEVVDLRVDQLAGNTALVKVGIQSGPASVVNAHGARVDTMPAAKLSDVVLTIAVTPDGVVVVDILELGER
jgi:hypothetical protein